MLTPLPKIIQGGMGAGVSDWRLARAVSRTGQLGVVSGTALGHILCRRLECGDPGGDVRRALERFPFPRVAERILERYFVEGGKPGHVPYDRLAMPSLDHDDQAENRELSIAGNFVEVTLARETHDNPVGINYLEKIQIPHLPSLYGAMLAGVSVVICGAGIPLEFPGVMDALAGHNPTTYPVYVSRGDSWEAVRLAFDPRSVWEEGQSLPSLARPDFLPIVSSESLAKMLLRRSNGSVEGLVVEHHSAGGHNAPPRGWRRKGAGDPAVYGGRDEPDLAAIAALGVPFWLAGNYGTYERLQEALRIGAAGVQVGTVFALCTESGLAPELRTRLIQDAVAGEATVVTDGDASPTGFPFKVAAIEGTLSDPEVYAARRRVCDLGFLRAPYIREDGTLGYRCPAEPEESYVAKGGQRDDTIGRKCLCNALVANIGMPQRLPDGALELPLVTLGSNTEGLEAFCSADQPDYSAADAVRVLLGPDGDGSATPIA